MGEVGEWQSGMEGHVCVRVLTGDGTKVQVVSYHLLELVVQGAFLELQAEVMAQVRV